MMREKVRSKRKKLIAGLVVLMCACLIPVFSAGAETFAYAWEFNGTTDGFFANSSTRASSGGCLVQTIESGKNNAFLLSPSALSINAETYKYIKIKAKNNFSTAGRLSVQWTTAQDTAFDSSWTGAKSYIIGENVVVADDEFHDYTIDLSQHSGWTGTITRFRLNLAMWSITETNTIMVDYIRISDTLVPEIIEEDTAVIEYVSQPQQLSSFEVFIGPNQNGVKVEPDENGQYALKAGIYTYTAKAAGYSNHHKSFLVTEEDVTLGSKTLNIELPKWDMPGSWQVLTMYSPMDEILDTLFADPNPDIVLDTPAFEEGRRINSFTTQAEMELYMQSLSKTNMYLDKIGISGYGHSLHIAVFSKGADHSKWTGIEDAAAALKALGKPIVWYEAQIHGNETASGEGALAVMKNLSSAFGDEVLDDVSVVVIPRVNPDGSQYNRRTPDGVNDLNRDHIKLNFPETQALQKAFSLFDPEVSIDGHEYGPTIGTIDGEYFMSYYDTLISPATNLNIPKPIRDMAFSLYYSGVERALNDNGISCWLYHSGSPASGNLTGSAPGANQATNSYALRLGFSFLVETLIPGSGFNLRDNYPRRVKSHMISAQTIIELTAENAHDVMDVIGDARAQLVANGAKYDEDDVFVLTAKTTAETVSYQVIDMATQTVKVLERSFASTINSVADKVVIKPTAYIIPKEVQYQEVVQKLKWLGVEVRYLPKDTVISQSLQQYKVLTNTVDAAQTQGVYRNNITAEIESAGTVRFENGAYIFLLDQTAANLLMLLEPEHPEGFIIERVIDVATVAAGGALPVYRYIGDNPRTALGTLSEIEAVRSSAKAEIEQYAQDKGQASYTADNWAAITQIVNDCKSAIDLSESQQGITDAVAAAKTEIDAIKTIAVQLSEAKQTAKTEIEQYAQDKGQASYTADNWAAITQIVNDCKSAIDLSESQQGITDAVAAAKAEIYAVKTIALQLSEAKQTAKSEIEQYAQGKNQARYTADNWAAITQIVNDCKSAIDLSESQQDITDAVAAAKAEIDAVSKAQPLPPKGCGGQVQGISLIIVAAAFIVMLKKRSQIL